MCDLDFSSSVIATVANAGGSNLGPDTHAAPDCFVAMLLAMTDYANAEASNPSGRLPVGLIRSYGARGRNRPVPGSACTLPSRITTRPPLTVATGHPVNSMPSYGV